VYAVCVSTLVVAIAIGGGRKHGAVVSAGEAGESLSEVSTQYLDRSYSVLLYATPERGCAKRLAVHVIHRQAADSEDE
jgi:hypothetical protein